MTDLTVPEGFVEFSMQVMARAVKLRESGVTQAMAISELDWRIDEDKSDFVECAAYALLATVEPPTIEVVANG